MPSLRVKFPLLMVRCSPRQRRTRAGWVLPSMSLFRGAGFPACHLKPPLISTFSPSAPLDLLATNDRVQSYIRGHIKISLPPGFAGKRVGVRAFDKRSQVDVRHHPAFGHPPPPQVPADNRHTQAAASGSFRPCSLVPRTQEAPIASSRNSYQEPVSKPVAVKLRGTVTPATFINPRSLPSGVQSQPLF